MNTLLKSIYDENEPEGFDSAESFAAHVRKRVAQFDLVAIPLPVISNITEDLLQYASRTDPDKFNGWLLATADFLQVLITELGGAARTSPIVTAFPKKGRSPWVIFRDALRAANDAHPVCDYLDMIFDEKRYVRDIDVVPLSFHARPSLEIIGVS